MKTLMLLVVSFTTLLQANPVNYFAVEDEMAQLALCSHPLLSVGEMETLLQEKWSQEPEARDEVIMGVSLKQQSPSSLQLFRGLVSPIISYGQSDTLSRYEETMQQLLLKGSRGEVLPFLRSKRSYDLRKRVSKGCTEVICALKSIFGEAQAIKILWLAAKYGVNTSHLAGHDILGTEYVTAWSSEDLDVLIRAYSKLPAVFIQKDALKTVSIFKDSLDVPVNRETYATANMLFGSKWHKIPSVGTKESIVFHELAHNIASSLGLQNGNYRHSEWVFITGWSNVKPTASVSRYAMIKDADEDLAESITAYRYTPQKLKNTFSVRYEFIKKYIFNDKEFLTTEDCEP